MSQFRSVNMRFDELDLTYLREFEIFLRQRGNVNNSLATKFSVLKAVYNKAVSEGVFVPKSNPFSNSKWVAYGRTPANGPLRKRTSTN